jgi:long-subunit acyl-CoA synthetase (AMP-forming)
MSYKSILQHVYETEKSHPNKLWLTQPLPGGKTVNYTWKEALDEARKMASYLQNQGFERGSKISIVSKNCASFLIAELAIWMAGYTTVALYPTINEETGSYILQHSEVKLIFVGKLDTWDEIQRAIPDDMPKIAMPQAPATDFTKWKDIISDTEALAGEPDREENELALILYTSGSTGRPKGVMHGFGPISNVARKMVKTLSISGEDRMLSYLPLAHVFERSCVDFTSLVGRSHLFFAESLETFVADINRCQPTLFVSFQDYGSSFNLAYSRKCLQKSWEFYLSCPLLEAEFKTRSFLDSVFHKFDLPYLALLLFRRN